MSETKGNANFPENREYWEAAENGVLLVKHCTACDKPHYYPRARCPFCGSDNTIWRQSQGQGEIYSFTIIHYAAEPYCQAYVTIDEGVTMITNIVDYEPDVLKIGARVHVVFRPGADGKAAPMFTLS